MTYRILTLRVGHQVCLTCVFIPRSSVGGTTRILLVSMVLLCLKVPEFITALATSSFMSIR